MDEQTVVQNAASELEVIAPAVVEETPVSVDDIIAGLKGFGIEELEEIITLQSAGRSVRLKISNIPTSDEMLAVQSSDEFKGYLWVKRVKSEILSRSITWINGLNIRTLPADKRFVVDPTDKNLRDIQIVLRNLILGWGQETMELLWKVVMTHAQNIEDRLKGQFPSNVVMTEVERRLFENAQKQIDEAQQAIVDEAVSELYDAAAPEAK